VIDTESGRDRQRRISNRCWRHYSIEYGPTWSEICSSAPHGLRCLSLVGRLCAGFSRYHHRGFGVSFFVQTLNKLTSINRSMNRWLTPCILGSLILLSSCLSNHSRSFSAFGFGFLGSIHLNSTLRPWRPLKLKDHYYTSQCTNGNWTLASRYGSSFLTSGYPYMNCEYSNMDSGLHQTLSHRNRPSLPRNSFYYGLRSNGPIRSFRSVRHNGRSKTTIEEWYEKKSAVRTWSYKSRGI
jgi:hypothetical protein